MFQSLNKNNMRRFTLQFINNLKSYKMLTNDIGPSLTKGEIGTKLQEFCVNATIQVGFPFLDDDACYDMILEFFDSYPSSQEWLNLTYEKCKKVYKQNKTNKQNKVG